MKESIKKKFDSIDQSKIKVESTKELLAKIEKALNGKSEENADKAEALLDKFISQAKAKNADIFVSKKAEPTLTPTEKKKANQAVKSKLETLMDTINNDPLLKDFNNARRSKGGGKSDPLIDSERKARESGIRISKKGWKNQYGKSSGGRKYYEYRENRIDRKAPNYGNRPWLEDGGFIHPSDANADKFVVVEIKEDGSRREHNNFGDFETAMMFASLKREFLPKGSQLIIEDKNGKNLYRSFKSGGQVDESTAMVLSQNKAIAHHTEELKKALEKNKSVEPWVVGKIERASTDISDVTHYLDGKTEYAKGGYMADGGKVRWQDVFAGDNALVIAENKMGVVIKPYGRRFHLRFPDGSEKTYSAEELEFFKDDEFAKGGEIQVAVGDKVKSKSGVEGIVYESMGTMFKLEDKYGNKSPKYHSSKNFKPSEITKGNIMAKGGEMGFEKLSDKVAKNYVGDKVKPKYQKEYGKTYDKAEAKEVGDKVAAKVYRQQLAKMAKGGKLAEDLDRYFTKTRTTKIVKISDLIPLRARPTGIENAHKYMKMAYDGEMAKRKPITIYKAGKGKYRVQDGNSTFAVAKANGWENIYADVVKNPNYSSSRMKTGGLFLKAKEIRKEGEPWQDAVKRAKTMM